ncbi:MAG TPA: branched-chain amino acid ABC transporter permease [Thermodesulfobacteriota bacterium]|nr:branched-chain amino acid ABC transporter permease [Thermodesulfobacteriota bacterium]
MTEVAARYRKKRLDRGIKARADTVFAIASFKEILYLLLPRAVPVIALLVLPIVLKGYWGKVLVYACIFGLLALSWDFLACCGLFSLGQALFFGLGAYVAGILSYYLHWPPVLTIPAAILGGGLLSAALLSPVLRLRGVYFAMVTLMMPLLFMKMIETTGLFGGSHGLSALPPFPNEWVAKYLAVGAFLFVLFIFRRMMSEDYGLVLKAIRDDDRAVMSAGINIYWRKTQALFVAGAVGAFAGAFMTHHYQFVGMTVFALDYSILPLAGSALGGPGTFAGPALGSMILIPLSEALRALGGLRIALYCIILILSVIALPEGVFHYIERRYHQFERLVKVG